MKRPALVLIVAVAENGVIGRNGIMPWRLKSDLTNFRAATMGKPLVMGRKTFAAIGRPLDGRTTIAVSRDPAFAAPGIVVAASLEAALAAARGDAMRRNADEIMIAGGAQIYAQAMPLADRIVLTRVHLRPEGDARFELASPGSWREVNRVDQAAGPDDEASFTTFVYERADAEHRAAPGAR